MLKSLFSSLYIFASFWIFFYLRFLQQALETHLTIFQPVISFLLRGFHCRLLIFHLHIFLFKFFQIFAHFEMVLFYFVRMQLFDLVPKNQTSWNCKWKERAICECELSSYCLSSSDLLPHSVLKTVYTAFY